MSTNGITQAIDRIIILASELASKQLRALLETKHLYQSVSIDPKDCIESVASGVWGPQRPGSFNAYIFNALPDSPFIATTDWRGPVGRQWDEEEIEQMLLITLKNVKLYCSICESRETFEVIYYQDIGNHAYKQERRAVASFGASPSSQGDKKRPLIEQHFSIACRCPNCYREVVAVIVKRKGWKLSLEGRSPVEGIETPTYIPKADRGLYGEVILARNVGKWLAAIALLRILIEQFARRQCNSGVSRLTGDELMDSYSKTLPSQYRGMMPSLKEWYDKLSEAIHTANPDEALFGKALDEIEKHFKLRHAYNIPGAKGIEN